MNENRMFAHKDVPVKVGDELEVKIEAVGEKGDGIAKMNGFVLFVPNTKEGDLVKIKVSRVLKNVGFAEVIGEAENVPEKGGTEQETPAEEEDQSKDDEPEAQEDTEDFGENLEEEKKE